MSKEFKVGDRVRVAKQSTDHLDKDAVKGDTGTVVVVGVWGAVLVKFDQPRKQYSSGRSLKLKNGYWCNSETLEHIDTDPAATEKIIITTDGKTTTARRYKGKELLVSAEAVCSPSDPFDFTKGACVAFGRLTGYVHKPATIEEVEAKPEPKFKVGDVVRVKGNTQVDHGLAVGSLAVIYKVKPSTFYGYVYSCDGGELRQHVGEADLEKFDIKGE